MTRTRIVTTLALAIQVVVLPTILGAQNRSGRSATLPMASPEDVGMSSDRLARVSAAMQGYVDRHEVAGIVSLVARHGKIVHFESFGMRDVENGAPMTKETHGTIFHPAALAGIRTLFALPQEQGDK